MRTVRFRTVRIPRPWDRSTCVYPPLPGALARVGVPALRILEPMSDVAKVHEIALHSTAAECPGPTLELFRDPYTSLQQRAP